MVLLRYHIDRVKNRSPIKIKLKEDCHDLPQITEIDIANSKKDRASIRNKEKAQQEIR